MASFEPPLSTSGGRNRFRVMPMAAPARMEKKETRNAAVELMVSSPCHDAGRWGAGSTAYRGGRPWATRDDLLRRNNRDGNVVAISNRTLDHRYPPCVR